MKSLFIFLFLIQASSSAFAQNLNIDQLNSVGQKLCDVSRFTDRCREKVSQYFTQWTVPDEPTQYGSTYELISYTAGFIANICSGEWQYSNNYMNSVSDCLDEAMKAYADENPFNSELREALDNHCAKKSRSAETRLDALMILHNKYLHSRSHIGSRGDMKHYEYGSGWVH